MQSFEKAIIFQPLQYQYIIKQASDENREKYQVVS